MIGGRAGWRGMSKAPNALLTVTGRTPTIIDLDLREGAALTVTVTGIDQARISISRDGEISLDHWMPKIDPDLLGHDLFFAARGARDAHGLDDAGEVLAAAGVVLEEDLLPPQPSAPVDAEGLLRSMLGPDILDEMAAMEPGS